MIHGFEIGAHFQWGEGASLTSREAAEEPHSLGRDSQDVDVSNNPGAAKRRKNLSLGREPQDSCRKKFQSREAATDIPSLPPGAHAAGQDLPPLQGWMLVAACSWGSRPRLCICRAFGARDPKPDTGRAANPKSGFAFSYAVTNPKFEIRIHPFPIMWYCHRSRSEKWKRGDIASSPVRPMLCSRKWSSANRPSMSGSGGTSKPA